MVAAEPKTGRSGRRPSDPGTIPDPISPKDGTSAWLGASGSGCRGRSPPGMWRLGRRTMRARRLGHPRWHRGILVAVLGVLGLLPGTLTASAQAANPAPGASGAPA